MKTRKLPAAAAGPDLRGREAGPGGAGHLPRLHTGRVAGLALLPCWQVVAINLLRGRPEPGTDVCPTPRHADTVVQPGHLSPVPLLCLIASQSLSNIYLLVCLATAGVMLRL